VEQVLNPMTKKKQHHAMTLRINDQYNSYLDYMAIRTGLDKTQLIRLAIHLMPFNEDFQRICDHYYNMNPRSMKDRFVFMNIWNQDSFLWKRV
jgi:hypothetical protein